METYPAQLVPSQALGKHSVDWLQCDIAVGMGSTQLPSSPASSRNSMCKNYCGTRTHDLSFSGNAILWWGKLLAFLRQYGELIYKTIEK